MLRQCLHRRPTGLLHSRNTSHGRHASTTPKPSFRSRLRAPFDRLAIWVWNKGPLYFLTSAFGGLLFLHVAYGYFFEYNGAYGASMVPTIMMEGESLLISKWYRRGRGVQFGDIVSFAHPVKTGERAVKRVIGMPGDFVLRDTPGTSGTMVQVPEGHCWVAGDNLLHSRDSRMFGPLPLALVKGKAIAHFYPWWKVWKPQPMDNTLLPLADEDDVD